MSKRVLICHRDGERLIALTDEGALLSLCQDRPGIQAEQIYLARVDRMVKGMEAAFVKLDQDTVGFLPYAECREKPRSGEKLLLQVKKPPVGDKAAYMTEDAALAGRYVILTPRSESVAVSRKIMDEGQRAALLSLGRQIVPEGMGLVMRTEAAEAAQDALILEVEGLQAKWQAILSKAESAQAPCLLSDREDALQRLMRDEHGKILEILTDEPEEIENASIPVRLCPDAFSIYSVDRQWEKARQRRVWLPCGGYLVIDKTEALTVIDVNSGKFTGGKSGAEGTFLKLNLEAAKEIARQMRLRSMGGIIICDFVDMQEESSQRQVRSALEEALRDDPVKCVVHGFTSLGLMEITRKKTQAP